MKKPIRKRAATKPGAGFSDSAVDAVFKAYPESIRTGLLALRRLILDTAKVTAGVGALQETLKWGSQAISRAKPKAAAQSGSIR
jgi:hypothetical protein